MLSMSQEKFSECQEPDQNVYLRKSFVFIKIKGGGEGG